MSSIHSTRSFLAHLAQGHSPRGFIPSELRRAAYDALRHTPRAGDWQWAEDVAGTFLLRLVEERRAGRSQVVWDQLDEDQFRATLHRRCRQIAVESISGWNLRRQLRSHVKAVLETPLPPPEASPATLFLNDRLSRALVAQATAALLAGREPPDRTVAAVTRALFSRYFGGEELSDTLPERPSENTVEEHVADAIDGLRLARRLQQELGSRSRVFQLRLQDAGYERIAQSERVAVGTAHARTKRAELAVHAVVKPADVSRGATVIAFHALRSTAHERRAA